MPKIIGLLPMGGQGLRLGMPFPKPLAPIITTSGVEPIYHHTLAHVRRVTTDVYAIVNSRTDDCLLRSLDSNKVKLLHIEAGELPGALGAAAREIAHLYGGETLILMALPDSIWRLAGDKSLLDLLGCLRRDGSIGLFIAGSDELDFVEVNEERVLSIRTKSSIAGMGTVRGWGTFIVRAAAMSGFHDGEKDGPQLGRLDMGWTLLGQYIDLGTPERYIRWHDTRGWNGDI